MAEPSGVAEIRQRPPRSRSPLDRIAVLVVALVSGAILWRPSQAGQSWQIVPVPELGLLGRAALSPDGRTLAVAEAGGSGRVAWIDPASGRVSVAAELSAPIRDLGFTPDGKGLLCGGADGSVVVLEVPTGRRLRRLRAPGAPLWAVAVGPRELAVAGEGSAIEVFPLDGSGSPRRLVGHQGWVRVLALRGQTLASGGHDGKVLLWNLTSGRRVRELKGHRGWISALGLSPDGSRLASADWDGHVRLWDAVSGKPLRAFTAGHSRAVTALSFDGAGRTLASGSLDRLVVLWDLASNRPRHILEAHRFAVTWVGFDDGHLLSVSSDGTARRWTLPLQLPPVAQAWPAVAAGEVTLRNNTTGERLRLRLLDARKRPLQEAARRLARFLRCGADDRRGALDEDLLRLLDRIAQHFGRDREILVISGYRSPAYNRLRTMQSRGVARESQHLSGTAIDLRVAGVSIVALRDVVKRWGLGGVGFYPDSHFVHVDVGPVRSWSGE